MKHDRDLTPGAAKAALDKLHKSLSKLSGEEAHDKLISILLRCMYDNGDGGFLWAHDLPIVKKIIMAKPAIRKASMEWFAGIEK